MARHKYSENGEVISLLDAESRTGRGIACSSVKRRGFDRGPYCEPEADSSRVCDKASNNEFSDDLICRMCGVQYSDPKLLPCLHTFCKRCLATKENSRVENHPADAVQQLIKCTLCPWSKELGDSFRKDAYLNALPSDFVVVNKLDARALESLNDEENEDDVMTVTCGADICGTRATQAVSRCSECALFLCSTCERVHRRTTTMKNHRISALALLDLQVGDSMHKVKYCGTHTGEELTFYCETCNGAVCNDCTFIDHPKKTHRITTLSDVTRSHRRRLAELLSSVRRKLPFLRRTLHDIDAVLESLPDHADAVAREIARNTESLVLALQRRQEVLLDELAKLCLHKASVLQDQKTRISSELRVLESNCGTTERILVDGSDSEISSVRNLVCERLRSFCESPIDIEAEESSEFGYQDDNEELRHLIDVYGKVYLTGTKSPLKVLGDGLYDAAVGKVAMFTMATAKLGELSAGDIDVRIETPDSVILACDVTQGDDCRLFNVFYNPKVPGEHEISIMVRGEHVPESPFAVNVKNGHMTFSKAHAHYTALGHHRGTDPGCFDQVCDVAVRNNGNILAVDCMNHRVQEFDSKGNFLALFGSKGEDLGRLLYPAGIAISHEGHVIITEHGNHRVQVFTSDGVHLWSFGTRGDGDGAMDHPTGVAVDEDGQLVIADKHNHRIQIFDQNGHLKRQFGCYGHQPGQFDRPMYVAISDEGEIVVTDSGNHRVQIFDERGRFREAFGRPGSGDGEFCYPSGITIDACGFVFVADRNNRIQVFDADMAFVTRLDTRDRGNGKLDDPMGLDYSPEGKIVVADKGNHKVKILYN